MGLAKVERKPFGPAERLATAERVGRECAAVGLTTIHNSILPIEDAMTYMEADAQERLKVRVLAIRSSRIRDRRGPARSGPWGEDRRPEGARDLGA